MIHRIRKLFRFRSWQVPHWTFCRGPLLEAIEIDYIDESEVLSPADDVFHIDKHAFKGSIVCGAKNLGEALRRISEGASMIRTRSRQGTGDVVQAVHHLRKINGEIARVAALRQDELFRRPSSSRCPMI